MSAHPGKTAIVVKAIDAMKGRNEDIRRSIEILERDPDMIVQTARSSSFRDGLARGDGASVRDCPHDGQADCGCGVTLTSVEAAAIARDPLAPERDQAAAVIEMQELAAELMVRAAELATRLLDRPPAVRDASSVTCVEQCCERLRGDGWDEKHPNGVAGRCKSCYNHRQYVHRAG